MIKPLIVCYGVFSFILLLLPGILFSQQNIKAIQEQIKTCTSDTQKVSLFLKMSGFYKGKEIAQAKYYSMQALHLAEKVPDYRCQINALNWLGRCLIDEYKLDSAIMLHKKALNLSTIYGLDKQRAWTENWLADALVYKEDFEAAISSYLASEEKALKMHDSILLGIIWRGIGNTYIKSGSYSDAMKYLLKALEINEKSHAKIGSVCRNLGQLNELLNQFPKALHYYRRSAEEGIKDGNVIGASYVYSDMGIVYGTLHQLDSALFYHKKALDIVLKAGHKLSAGVSYLNIAEIYRDQKKFDLALMYCKKGLDIYEKSGKFPAGTLNAYVGIANIYSSMDRLKEAELYVNKAVGLSNEVNDPETILQLYEVAGTIYSRLHLWQKAWEFNNRYFTMKDSLMSESTTKQIADIQTKYESEKKEKENELLRAINQIQELALIKEKHSRNFFILLSFLVILLVIITFSRFRVKKKANTELVEKNDLITQQKEKLVIALDELKEANMLKDKFFSIIAHDLKNPFNIIQGYASLLVDENDPPGEEDRKKYIEQIHDSAINTYKLLENLLTWARSQRGLIVINKEMTDLKILLRESITLVEPFSKQKNIQVVDQLPEKTMVFVDRTTTSIILNNMLNNAVKFTWHNGKINIWSEQQKNSLLVHISDTGTGIDSDIVKDLFLLEKTPVKEGTDSEKGTGLGLIICKEFAQKNDIELKVKSKPGEGSTFTLVFDITDPQFLSFWDPGA